MSAVNLVIVCAWCQRVRCGTERWEESRREPLAEEATHGICPECLAAQTREAVAAFECQ